MNQKLKNVIYLWFALLFSCDFASDAPEPELLLPTSNKFCERLDSGDYSAFQNVEQKCHYQHEDEQDIRTYEFIGCKTEAQYTQWLDSMRCNDYEGLTQMGVSFFGGIRTVSSGTIECDCSVEFNIQGYEYVGKFEEHLYYLSDQASSWTDANAQASQLGHLVTITSEDENQFIYNAIKDNSVWIGFHDSITEGNFEWVTGEDVDYTNWRRGSPNNWNNDDYTVFLSSDSWIDLPDADYTFRHIMEIE